MKIYAAALMSFGLVACAEPKQDTYSGIPMSTTERIFNECIKAVKHDSELDASAVDACQETAIDIAKLEASQDITIEAQP